MGAERRFLASLRARTTAVAVLIVGLALAVSAVTLLVLVRRSLVTNVDEAAKVLADEVGARAKVGTLPRILAVSGGRGNNDLVIQVVDDQGRVVAASQNYAGQPPISSEQPPLGTKRRTTLQGGGPHRARRESSASWLTASAHPMVRSLCTWRASWKTWTRPWHRPARPRHRRSHPAPPGRNPDLDAGGTGVATGRIDPVPGRRDLRRRPRPAGPRAAGERRDRPPGAHDERHARPPPGTGAALDDDITAHVLRHTFVTTPVCAAGPTSSPSPSSSDTPVSMKRPGATPTDEDRIRRPAGHADAAHPR